MILAWAGLVVVVALIGALLSVPAAAASVVHWPDDAPLNLHDNRGRDPHLRHLARVLTSDSPAEAQRVVADLAEAERRSAWPPRGSLDPQVARFVSDPPDRDHARFLHRLADALERIEQP